MPTICRLAKWRIAPTTGAANLRIAAKAASCALFPVVFGANKPERLKKPDPRLIHAILDAPAPDLRMP